MYKKVQVKRYRRFKNNRWEKVRDYERHVEINDLEKRIIDDIRGGKSIQLTVVSDDAYGVPFSEEWTEKNKLDAEILVLIREIDEINVHPTGKKKKKEILMKDLNSLMEKREKISDENDELYLFEKEWHEEILTDDYTNPYGNSEYSEYLDRLIKLSNTYYKRRKEEEIKKTNKK